MLDGAVTGIPRAIKVFLISVGAIVSVFLTSMARFAWQLSGDGY